MSQSNVQITFGAADDVEPSHITNFEDVTSFGLDPADEARLLELQDECTFGWVTKDGSPMSSIVNFVYDRGLFFVTTAVQRPRVKALMRDPRCVIVISSKGTAISVSQTVTYKATVEILSDRETKDWFYPALSARKHRDIEKAREYAAMLDSPDRVILRITPVKRVSYDGAKKAEATRLSREAGAI